MEVAKGFYINLSYRTDRRELIESELKRVGWFDLVERYEAVDGNSEYGKSIVCSPYDKREQWLSVARAALTSHKNVIQYAKDNNLENILVLEDDCKFYDRTYDQSYIEENSLKNWKAGLSVNAMETIQQALHQMDTIPEWNILLLGATLLPPINPLIQVAPNVVEIETALSCHAYIINHTGYDKLLWLANFELTIADPFTSMLDVLWNNVDKKYSVYPYAVIQQPTGVTDIGGITEVYTPYFWDRGYDRELIKSFNL